MLAEERADFAERFISSLIDAGLTEDEIGPAVKAAADILDLAEQEGVGAVEFTKLAMDKESFVGTLGKLISPSALSAAASRLFDGATSLAGSATGKLIEGGTRLAPWAAGAALVGPGLVGYGAGQLAGSLSDNPDPVIDTIRQQELISTLQRNTARLQQQKRRNQVSSEDVDDDAE